MAGRVASRVWFTNCALKLKAHLLSRQTPEPPPFYPSYHQPRVQQYPQGPQGDPFAQPPPVYVPVEEPVPLPAKPLKKRKRPPARVNDCATCGGNDSQNKAGLPELMVSCVDCGQSGMFLPFCALVLAR